MVEGALTIPVARLVLSALVQFVELIDGDGDDFGHCGNLSDWRRRGSIEQRQAQLRRNAAETAEPERARSILALAVSEDVARGVKFDEWPAMPTRPAAADTYRGVAVGADNLENGIAVPGHCAARFLAEGLAFDDVRHHAAFATLANRSSTSLGVAANTVQSP
ncbi:hypothetical protein GCM10009115_15180 [Sphingopyxis soli]|uniref:Uncharacterized protein n=1 Tax=Sphingopyxis soli TaxID=592051 RepID=A0ABN1M349_9SPHN